MTIHGMSNASIALTTIAAGILLSLGFPTSARVQSRGFSDRQIEAFTHFTFASPIRGFVSTCSRQHGANSSVVGHGGMTRQMCAFGPGETLSADYCAEVPWTISRNEQDLAPVSSAYRSAVQEGDQDLGRGTRVPNSTPNSATWRLRNHECSVYVSRDTSNTFTNVRRTCTSSEGRFYAIGHCNLGDP